eukprot:1186492-Prorocentrum_minimum.AAC.6
MWPLSTWLREAVMPASTSTICGILRWNWSAYGSRAYRSCQKDSHTGSENGGRSRTCDNGRQSAHTVSRVSGARNKLYPNDYRKSLPK